MRSEDERASGSESEMELIDGMKVKIHEPPRKRGVKKKLFPDTAAGAQRVSTVFRGYEFNAVLVVDYDLTLVDDDAKPFPGAHGFLRRLHRFNNGNVTMVLFSHANANHIDHGFKTHFNDERKYFEAVISDHGMSPNKPVTRVRRVLRRVRDLAGPIAIIDDLRSNLDDDQYDITIDVSRFFKRDETKRVVSVDYDSVMYWLGRGVEDFLKTKAKK